MGSCGETPLWVLPPTRAFLCQHFSALPRKKCLCDGQIRDSGPSLFVSSTFVNLTQYGCWPTVEALTWPPRWEGTSGHIWEVMEGISVNLVLRGNCYPCGEALNGSPTDTWGSPYAGCCWNWLIRRFLHAIQYPRGIAWRNNLLFHSAIL